MNPLLLLAIVTSYTNAYIEDVPFDSATFNRAYNLASNSLSTTSISLKDWGRWQRKVLHALDMLSHPTAQKDNYAVEFREAIEFGDTKDLEYLIQNGLRLTANEARKLDAGGWTLIHFAAKHNLPLIPLLIRLGVDPNAKTHNSQATALQIAVEGNCEVVSLSLLNYRNIVVSPANSQGYTPLYYAAKNGNAYILNLLLAKGAYLTNNDIHRPDEQGKTLLHYASRHGAETLVSLLIAQQADPNIQSNSIQETPLHLAVKNGHSKVAKLLLRTAVGIKVDLKDSFGKTAYDYVQEQSTEFRDYEVLQEIVNWRAWQHQPIAPKRAFNTFS